MVPYCRSLNCSGSVAIDESGQISESQSIRTFEHLILLSTFQSDSGIGVTVGQEVKE